MRGIKDGAVRDFPVTAETASQGPRTEPKEVPGLKAGAIWGVDGHGANGRKNLPPRGYISEKAVDRLSLETFDVLLSHDAPKDAKRVGYGSELLAALIESAQPRFAFFGHYGGDGGRSEADFGHTEVYHLAGFELRTRDGRPESGSVGVLEWQNGEGTFELIEDDDLKGFTRHNWKWV